MGFPGLLLRSPDLLPEKSCSHCTCALGVCWGSHLDSSIWSKGAITPPFPALPLILLCMTSRTAAPASGLKLLVTAFLPPARVKKGTRPLLRPLLPLASSS